MVSYKRNLSLILFILSVSAVLAQTGLKVTIQQIDANNFPFIFTTVTVTENGQGVSDLQKTNFQAFEDNVLQTDYFDVIPPASGGGVRLVDFIFIIDNSGSMGGEINAVKNNVNAFAQSMANQGIDFRLGAVKFGQTSGSGEPVIFNNGNMTSDLNTFQSWISQMSASGGIEPGLRAIIQSATAFNFRPGSQRHFLLITDEDSDGGSLAEAINVCQANNIVVHAAVDPNFGNSYYHYVKPGTSISGATGGLVFPVQGPYDDILDKLGQTIANTYIVRYKTNNLTIVPGAKRAVRIETNYNAQQDSDTGYYIPGAGPAITLTTETISLMLNPQTEGTSLRISAVILDDVAPFVFIALAYYRPVTSSDNSFKSIIMNRVSGDLFEAFIPGYEVNSPGLLFYITATDGQLTATNPPVEPAENAYNIAVLPNVAPHIIHTPVTSALAGTDIAISAKVIDNTNDVAQVFLFYRRTGTLLYETAVMAPVSGNEYKGTIPKSFVTADGVDYFIRAFDDLGIASFDGVHKINVVMQDLILDSIRVVQVIFNVNIDDDPSRIDLVKDKATAILAYLNYTGGNNVQRDVTIELSFDGSKEVKTITPIEYEEILNRRSIKRNYLEFIIDPKNVGNKQVTVTIDPFDEFLESNENNNEDASDITIKDTEDLVLNYIPISRNEVFSGYGPINRDDFDQTVTESSDFIKATYPIAEENLTVFKYPLNTYGSLIKGDVGTVLDLLETWLIANITRVSTDRAIGIVPDDYFKYHYDDPDQTGMMSIGINSALSIVNDWVTPAHEVGHTYGLWDGDEEEYDGPGCGNLSYGYWVSKSDYRDHLYCFMGCAPLPKRTNRWVDNEDYSELFRTFRKNKNDPEVLLLSGTIDKEANVKFNNFYIIESGMIEEEQSGNYSVRLIDFGGNLVDDISFRAEFKIHRDPIGVTESEIAGFTIIIPYSKNVTTIQIVHNNQIISEVNSNAKTLLDAIGLIPDYGFDHDPEERRMSLAEKIMAFEQMIETNRPKPAVNKLIMDIRDKITKWIKDDYEIETPLQYTKQKVLDLIDEIYLRIENHYQAD